MVEKIEMESGELRIAMTEVEQTKANGHRWETGSVETKPETKTNFTLEGCLTLGGIDGNQKYVTVHSIDYGARNYPQIETTEHLPCGRVTPPAPVISTVLGALRSEVSLYCLHLAVISLGVIKESVVVHGGEPTHAARLVYTSVETASAVVLVLVRTANAWTALSSAGAEIDRMGFFGGRVAIPAWRSLVRFFRAVSVAAGCLVVVCLVSFVVCLTVEQLEWTVLSNIVCIVTANLLSALFAVRVTRTLCRVRSDAYRLVALEAVWMLKSADRSAEEETAEDDEEDERTAARSRRAFVDAFESTPMFQVARLYMRRVEHATASGSSVSNNGLDISGNCSSDVDNAGSSNSIAWNTYL